MQIFFISFLILLIDRLTKYLVMRQMEEFQTIPIIKDVFHFTFIYNKGAAFGMLQNKQWLFILLALALLVAAYLLRKHIKASDNYVRFGVALLVSGAIGNLIDRIVYNKVVDFLDFIIWPIFNIADIAICVGVAMISWSILREDILPKS